MEKKIKLINCQVTATGQNNVFFAFMNYVYRWNSTIEKPELVFDSETERFNMVFQLFVRSSAVAGQPGIVDTHLVVIDHGGKMTVLDINHYSEKPVVVFDTVVKSKNRDVVFYKDLLLIDIDNVGIHVYDIHSGVLQTSFECPAESIGVVIEQDYIFALLMREIGSCVCYWDVSELDKRHPKRPNVVKPIEANIIKHQEMEEPRSVILTPDYLIVSQTNKVLVFDAPSDKKATLLKTIQCTEDFDFLPPFLMGENLVLVSTDYLTDEESLVEVYPVSKIADLRTDPILLLELEHSIRKVFVDHKSGFFFMVGKDGQLSKACVQPDDPADLLDVKYPHNDVKHVTMSHDPKKVVVVREDAVVSLVDLDHFDEEGTEIKFN